MLFPVVLSHSEGGLFVLYDLFVLSGLLEAFSRAEREILSDVKIIWPNLPRPAAEKKDGATDCIILSPACHFFFRNKNVRLNGLYPAIVTPAPPPDFFNDDRKMVTKLILKTSMTSFQLYELVQSK